MSRIDRLEGQIPLPLPVTEPPSTALKRWWEETGEAVSDLALMGRKPTTERPFLYELRFDLMPTKGGAGFLVAKGFGPDGSIITFHDCTGLVDGLRGFRGRLKSGKCNWLPDAYPSSQYERKLELYLSGEVYRLD